MLDFGDRMAPKKGKFLNPSSPLAGRLGERGGEGRGEGRGVTREEGRECVQESDHLLQELEHVETPLTH